MVSGKERMKNNPQNTKFFHPESKTAGIHIVPVSILQSAMRKIQGLKDLYLRFCLVSSFFLRTAPK